MRKAIRFLEYAGLLSVLLVAGDAFSQFPGGRGGGGGGGGARFFDFIAQGQPTVDIARLPARMQETMVQYAQQAGITNGKVTREQFAAFIEWRRSQGGGRGAGPAKGPDGGAGAGGPGFGGGFGRRRFPGGFGPFGPGGGPESAAQVAEREFRSLDTNRDGFLSEDEIPPARAQELEKYANDDGKIDLGSYVRYVEAREQSRGRPQEADQENDLDRRPVVFRAGKLPKELPPWFEKYDTDKDGQVSLYEWRMAGEALEKFAAMDRNDDGLLTAEEVLRYEKLARGSRPGQPGTQTARLGEEAPSIAPRFGGPRGNRGPGNGKGRRRFRQQGAQE